MRIGTAIKYFMLLTGNITSIRLFNHKANLVKEVICKYHCSDSHYLAQIKKKGQLFMPLLFRAELKKKEANEK